MKRERLRRKATAKHNGYGYGYGYGYGKCCTGRSACATGSGGLVRGGASVSWTDDDLRTCGFAGSA